MRRCYVTSQFPLPTKVCPLLFERRPGGQSQRRDSSSNTIAIPLSNLFISPLLRPPRPSQRRIITVTGDVRINECKTDGSAYHSRSSFDYRAHPDSTSKNSSREPEQWRVSACAPAARRVRVCDFNGNAKPDDFSLKHSGRIASLSTQLKCKCMKVEAAKTRKKGSYYQLYTSEHKGHDNLSAHFNCEDVFALLPAISYRRNSYRRRHRIHFRSDFVSRVAPCAAVFKHNAPLNGLITGKVAEQTPTFSRAPRRLGAALRDRHRGHVCESDCPCGCVAKANTTESQLLAALALQM